MIYYIGIDIGTSSVKAMLINENEIQNTISKDYPIYLSNGNYAEQNPEDWYRQSIAAMKELLRDVDKSEVKAIGFCGQMHGLVLLDEKDEVIRPAILWNDGRSEKEVDYLNNKIGKDFLLDNTGNIAFAGFTAPKLLWVYNHEPDNFKRISKILLPKDYVAFMLSGVFATDVSDAAGTLYFDTEHRCWSKPMLQLLHIDESFLPAVYESSQSVGCIKEKLADELGLCPDTKIIIGAGDNAASAIGTGTVNDGDCNISLGTSGTIFACTEKYNCDRKNAIHSFCSANGKYHYYVENNHPAIIERAVFDRVQEEISRRNSKKKVKQVGTKTELGKYSSKYALSEILYCGNCGTPYRRCTWSKSGKKKIVWRCISRLDYGKKYCKDSPSIEESVLHNAIAEAITKKAQMEKADVARIRRHIEIHQNSQDTSSILAKQERLKTIQEHINQLTNMDSEAAQNGDFDTQFESPYAEMYAIKDELEEIEKSKSKFETATDSIEEMTSIMQGLKNHSVEYNDLVVRQLIECIKVISKEILHIYFKDGIKIEAQM